MQKIIAFEGIPGSGKTTQLKLAKAYLSSHSEILLELNRYSPLKEVIQKWKERTFRTELRCFYEEDIIALARARAITQKSILKSLAGQNYILADRSVYTAMVYESGILTMSQIEDINRSEEVVFPDFGFIFDCNPNIALQRIDKRRIEENMYGSRSMHESLEDLTKKRESYLSLPGRHPELKIINSDQSEDSTFQQIIAKL